MSTLELIKDISKEFSDKGIDSSNVEAEAIVQEVLGCNRIALYLEDITLSYNQSLSIENMVERRLSGEPLQHVIGKVIFYGNEICVKKGVFIPRPETEILVDEVIKCLKNYEIRDTSNEIRILDLCTGSGNIAISLTKALNACKIIASDISDAAIKLGKHNAKLNSVSEEIDFIKADLFDVLSKYKGSFDLIVSNPPYIDSKHLEKLPDEVKCDPIAALDGGVGGLDFYRRIINNAELFLKSQGHIFLELADGISKDVYSIFKNSNSFSDIKIAKDLNSIDRVISAKRI